MALTKCPDCGKEFSDLAQACPNCGRPNIVVSYSPNENNISKGGYNTSSPVYAYENTEVSSNNVTGLSIAALIFSILGCTFFLGIVFAIIDLINNKDRNTILSKISLVICCLWVFIEIFGMAFSKNVKETTVETTDILIESTENPKEENTIYETVTTPPYEEAESVFFLNLTQIPEQYKNKYIVTTLQVNYCGTDEIRSLPGGNTTITIYPDNYSEFEHGTYITVTGFVQYNPENNFVSLSDAHITGYGNDSQLQYESDLAAYNEVLKIKAEEYERAFKEEAVSVTYDELSRYPDSYKTTKIKLIVKITDVEPDGIILPGHYEAVVKGTSNTLAVYDGREIQEPKLIKGDIVTIYGYGDGLTTIKVQDQSGIIPKTIDKYTIPGVKIQFVEIQ